MSGNDVLTIMTNKEIHTKNLISIKDALTIFTFMLGSLMGILHPLYSQAPKVQTIVIDAGHGGHDPGCLGKKSFEKDVALEIALKLGVLINTHLPDVKVIYTRDNDTFIELNQRSKIANRARADLFLSIHCNASKNKEATGTETYIMGLNATNQNFQLAMRENSVIFQEKDYERTYEGFDPTSPISYILLSNYQQSHQVNSLDLASSIESQFSEKYKKTSRGVKQAGFLVLAKTTMPSVLIETGFLSNQKDEEYLNSELGQMEIAVSIYRAFRNYKQSIEGELFNY